MPTYNDAMIDTGLGFPDMSGGCQERAAEPEAQNTGTMPPPGENNWMFGDSGKTPQEETQEDNGISMDAFFQESGFVESPAQDSVEEPEEMPECDIEQNDATADYTEIVSETIQEEPVITPEEAPLEQTVPEEPIKEAHPVRLVSQSSGKAVVINSDKQKTLEQKVRTRMENQNGKNVERTEDYWLDIIAANPQLNYYQAEIMRLVCTGEELPRAQKLLERLIAQ